MPFELPVTMATFPDKSGMGAPPQYQPPATSAIVVDESTLRIPSAPLIRIATLRFGPPDDSPWRIFDSLRRAFIAASGRLDSF
jgi:hypothetical protein